MVTFKLGSIIGSEIEVGKQGVVIRGPARQDVLKVIEIDRQIVRIHQPGTFRVQLTLSYDEKLALAAALKQAAQNQKNS